MSSAHLEWSPTASTERPMILTFLRSNSGLIFAMYPSSVVHTGVKSRGCENRTAHESPIHSWKRIGPSVVSASKSGAVSPICSAIFFLLWGCVTSTWFRPETQLPIQLVQVRARRPCARSYDGLRPRNVPLHDGDPAILAADGLRSAGPPPAAREGSRR